MNNNNSILKNKTYKFDSFENQVPNMSHYNSWSDMVYLKKKSKKGTINQQNWLEDYVLEKILKVSWP